MRAEIESSRSQSCASAILTGAAISPLPCLCKEKGNEIELVVVGGRGKL